MKVRELKEALEVYDDEMPVRFVYTYGDYWRTAVADEVNEIGVLGVVYSDYHSMDKIADEKDEDMREVVTLSSRVR